MSEWTPSSTFAAASPSPAKHRRRGGHLVRYVGTWVFGIGVLLALAASLLMVGVTKHSSSQYVSTLDASTAKIASATRAYNAADGAAERKSARAEVAAATKANQELRETIAPPVSLDATPLFITAGGLFLAFVLVRSWRPAVYEYGRGV